MKKHVLILLMLLAVCLSSCSQAETSSTTLHTTIDKTDVVAQATLDRYRTNEIEAYQGVRLDPAIGPRDNSIKGVQEVSIATYRLKINGLVSKPVELTYDEVLAMTPAERKVTLHCVEGWDATILWKGVQLSNLLALTTIDSKANTVIFHCIDGYTTALPLETIVDNKLILAYQANGLPLPPEMGYPFIVVAEDKLGYKWARWVYQIELSADSAYKGYWESRGYDNDADIED